MKDDLTANAFNESQSNAFFLDTGRRSFSLKKLVNAKKKYDDEIKEIYNKIKPLVEFDFFIMHQASDGFVIVHQEKTHNARLSVCIRIIEDKGKLNYEDYLLECI